MSEPHEPAPDHGAHPAEGAGADQPAAEPAAEPAAPAGSPGEPPPAAHPHPGPPPVGQPVAAPRGRRFGPAFGRFARSRATQLAAAMVAGALVGGGTVAIVDAAYAHGAGNHHGVRIGRAGGPFGNENGPRHWFNGGNPPRPGGQGFGG